MARATIDYGIDLGTTNSSVAVLDGTTPQVIRNNRGDETTPSAVSADSRGRLMVGRKAKERVQDDDANAHSEFKLQMGEPTEYLFAASGLKMPPEQLSAEVLKSLRADVQQRTGEEITAAVITVPAAFDLPQCDATRKAAQLAGLTSSPLLQEPIAASLAYGFQSDSEKAFWMVYDFGGGTFDCAIMQVRDGAITVINHGGDNHLGGKYIDWAIVDRLLVPHLTSQYDLPDFQRGNKAWRAAFAKLKMQAEEAKIQLSRDSVAPIFVDRVCMDNGGKWVTLDYDMNRSDVEKLAEPFVEQSLGICAKTLSEAGLSAGNIERLLLVGGPTLTPLFREMLTSRLGIALDFRVDPLTVVSQGAAIFAGTQRLEVAPPKVGSGQYGVQLEYEPVGNDAEPLVGGKVSPDGAGSVDGFTVEFVEAKSQWRSGKLTLSEQGTFMTNLRAEKGRANQYMIELRDATGIQHETVPDSLTYTMGLIIDAAPLIHTIGVALANNQMQPFITKGTRLPARRREIHSTTAAITAGQSGTLIRIPVVEGGNTRRADRNHLIGELLVTGDQITRDLPAGSEVQITIDIDESRQTCAEAYIPFLDRTVDQVLRLGKETPDPDELADQFAREKDRLREARANVEAIKDAQAQAALDKIDREKMVQDVDSALTAAKSDPDAANKCCNRLLDLRSSIDDVEDALEWPSTVSEADKELKETREIVAEHGSASDTVALDSLEKEARAAIAANDRDLLARKVEQVKSLGTRVLLEQPGFWVAIFRDLETKRSEMSDRGLADRLFTQGNAAIQSGNVDGLKSAVRALMDLLPASVRQEVRGGYGGTTMPV